MSVAIVGGTGFIGSALVRRVLAPGGLLLVETAALLDTTTDKLEFIDVA